MELMGGADTQRPHSLRLMWIMWIIHHLYEMVMVMSLLIFSKQDVTELKYQTVFFKPKLI